MNPNNNEPSLNLPTGFEKMLFEGMVRAFFIGQSYMNSGGYMQTDPAPMTAVTQQVAQKITPTLVEAIMRQIDVEKLASEIMAKIDIKAIKAQVTKEVKAKIVKKLSA